MSCASFNISGSNIFNDDDDAVRSTWPLHVKDVSRISIDALRRLPYRSEDLRKAFDHAIAWLYDLDRYVSVPRRSPSGAPRARLSDEWVAALLHHGVIEATSRARVAGWVRMFAVPEPAKTRFRPIKYTADINNTLGRDTLMKLRFPTKNDIVGLVHKGSHFIALDFSSYYDQFVYAENIRKLLCFRHEGKFYHLRTLAMGQRQAVETAHSTTKLLLDFDRRSHAEAVIDNVIFVGSEEDVLHDARVFVERVKAANGQLNEDVSDLRALVHTSGEWCGVALDFSAKTVALTQKSLAKVAASWGHRASWTWRGFAAHIGLLFWAWGILDLPMHEFFPVLSFVSRVGRDLTDDESLWDAPAFIWDSVWPVLERWTTLLSANAPRTVPRESTPEWLVLTDASRWGWGYVALHEGSGELRHHGAPWSSYMERQYGDKLGSSVFAEPHGVVNALCHLFRPGTRERVRLGTDNTATRASFERGFNSRSPAINACITRMRAVFPLLDIDFVYVPGVENLADGRSRGLQAIGGATDRVQDLAESLRRVMGSASSQPEKEQL